MVFSHNSSIWEVETVESVVLVQGQPWLQDSKFENILGHLGTYLRNN